MKILHIAAVLMLGLVRLLATGEETAEFVIPEALRFTGPEIAVAENNLPRFLDAIGPSLAEEVKAVREARQQLSAGKGIQHVELLEKLRARHLRANESLAPPLAFIQDMGSATTTPLFLLFQGSELLARLAMLEKDYSRANRLLGDMFRWSHLLRNSRPNFVQMLVARFGWLTAFNMILRDWVNHPDQAKRFNEIEKFAGSNRLERSELIESLKAEFHWVVAVGGVRKMLADERFAGVAALSLIPPFNELSVPQLLKLPYDAQADFRHESDEVLARLECLKKRRTHRPVTRIQASGKREHS